MSTITREFTTEQLIEHLRTRIEHRSGIIANMHIDRGYRDYLKLELRSSEIALASLEAEAVAFRSKLQPPSAIGSEHWDYTDHRQPDAFELENCVIERLYTAPPAPVSVPDAYIRDERGRMMLNGKPEPRIGYGGGWNAFRDAMLQGAEPVTTAYKLPANTLCKEAPEHIWLQTAWVWPDNGEFSELTWCSDNHHEDDTLYVRADVVTGNSPVVPDELIRRIAFNLVYLSADEKLRSDDDSLFSLVRCGMDEFRRELDDYVRPPVVPDGYTWMPVDPTEAMLEAGKCIAGLTKRPETVRLVYEAMLAAAPQQEVKNG